MLLFILLIRPQRSIVSASDGYPRTEVTHLWFWLQMCEFIFPKCFYLISRFCYYKIMHALSQE